MYESNNETIESTHQWRKFGILTGIFAVVIFVIVLIRPLIFNRIVPAVMGEGQTAVVEEGEMVEETPAVEETFIPDEIEVIVETTTNETLVTINGDSFINGEDSVIEESVVDDQNEGEETAVSPIIYTVKAGDTIYSIARTYAITPADIVTANNVADANNILIGTELLIPQP